MLKKSVLPLVITLGLLLGLTWQKRSYPTAGDADGYHQQVRTAIEAIPVEIGSWVGTDVPVPPAALAMLRPNAIVSRRYINKRTGRHVDMLVEQCRDARDMAGHYPPVCYPSSGWTPQKETPMQWTIADGLTIHGTEYEFSQMLPERASLIVVDSVFVLPDGSITRDMKGVRMLAADYRRHFYGAGQIQVVFSTHMPADERKRITELLLGAVRPVVEAISSGVIDE